MPRLTSGSREPGVRSLSREVHDVGVLADARSEPIASPWRPAPRSLASCGLVKYGITEADDRAVNPASRRRQEMTRRSALGDYRTRLRRDLGITADLGLGENQQC